MSVLVSQSRFSLLVSSIDRARIVAISTTISIHIVAFLFLMAPVSIPDLAKPVEIRTEITIVEPAKPKIIPPLVMPVKPKLVTIPTTSPALPVISKPFQTTQNIEATTSEPVAGDLYVPEQNVMNGLESSVVGGDVDASTRIQFPMQYPQAALRAGATGIVVVLVRYDDVGNVIQTSLHKGSQNKDLDRAALQGIKKWKINPRMIQGQAVGGEALVEVQFNL
jgi:protein TonB